MSTASFDQRGRSWSATCRQTWCALAASACRKAWRSAAATIVCWPLPTCAKALLIQWTRQRCQVAPSTRRIAALSPSWASETTSLTPLRPRLTRPLRNVAQKVSASLGPRCRPTISRRPSASTATAIMAATETIRPPSRTFSPGSGSAGPRPGSGRVEPQVRPLALQRPVEEGADPLVDVLAQLRDGALRDAREPHGLHQLVDPARGHAADPGLLDHRDERLLADLPGLEEGREVGALPELGDAQLQRAEPGVERAPPEAVAVVEPLRRALVAPGPDQALHVALHQQLQHGFRHRAQEVADAGLLQQLGQWQSVLGHRSSTRMRSRNSTLAERPDGHPSGEAAARLRRTRGGRSGAPPRTANPHHLRGR